MNEKEARSNGPDLPDAVCFYAGLPYFEAIVNVERPYRHEINGLCQLSEVLDRTNHLAGVRVLVVIP